MEPAGQARLAAAGVTAREAEVLSVIGSRLTNREIAERLCISVRTVESHVSALLRKLALPGRPALVALALQLAAEPALPVPPTSFVGREEELTQLRDLLAAAQLVCLTGPAGCGKTRLALEAARQWPGETRIAGLASAAAAEVGAIVASALGLGYEAADLATAARVALAGRRLLLVADDCDQVTGATAGQLTALVRAVPGLRVVATSRQPLGVSAAGDMMHASNARYMLAHQAVEAGERLTEVPVWLDECESYAASHGYRHELAHIHYVRAVYERQQGRLGTARELLDSALTVFRQAGDFRCTTRTLRELAEHHRPGHPEAAAGLLFQGLGMAMLASGESLTARVLASLTAAAAEAGDLPLAARAFGALDALGLPQSEPGRASAQTAIPADLARILQAPTWATYAEEGRAGGISLIITLYHDDRRSTAVVLPPTRESIFRR